LLAFLSCPLPPTLLITHDREAQARRGLLLYTGSPAGRAAIPKEVGAGLTDAQVDEVAAYVMRILSAPEVSRSFDIERFFLPPWSRRRGSGTRRELCPLSLVRALDPLYRPPLVSSLDLRSFSRAQLSVFFLPALSFLPYRWKPGS
jgi:hypothetical protein